MCSCRFALQAWHFVTYSTRVPGGMCVRVTVRGLKLPCLREKPQKHVFLDVSEDVVMSFCVAGVALCDIRRVSGGMCGHDRGESKVAVTMGIVAKT